MTKHSPYYGLAEPLLCRNDVLEKRMFGCDAVYLGHKLVLVFCDGKGEPWKGLLLPTERTHHQALMQEFPSLEPHSVLGKWLYLSESAEDFETTAEHLVVAISAGHPKLGVDSPRKSKKRRRTA